MSADDRTASFTALVTAVIEPLRRYLARRTDAATAEDVLSETLLACWRRVDDIPPDEPLAWTIGVARLCLANAQRSQRRRDRLASRVAVMDPPKIHDAESAEDTGDGTQARVATALSQLPETDTEILRMWAWDDLTPAQIAVTLGVSANAAGVRLHRARKRLRTALASTSGQNPDARPEAKGNS